MPPRKSTTRGDAARDATDDADMSDAPPPAQAAAGISNDPMESIEAGEQPDDDDDDDDTQRVRLLPGSTLTAASFEFLEEGHTLGNALRFIIMKNPDVEFCAYAIPHPSEPKMNLRIQTYDGSAIDALQKGLHDLQNLCDVVADKYQAAKEDFHSKMLD